MRGYVKMGFTQVRVTIINPVSALESNVDLLVDTGALLTFVPRKILESLGIKPIGKRRLRVYGGQVIERQVGAALVKYGDVQAGVTVLFAEEKDVAVLGATALEALGYQVDPVTKQLKPVELLMV